MSRKVKRRHIFLPSASTSGIRLASDTGDGEVLEFIVQRRRDKRAAPKLLRNPLKTHGFAPKTLVTDEWRAYVAATGDLGLTAWHHQGRQKSNSAENFH